MTSRLQGYGFEDRVMDGAPTSCSLKPERGRSGLVGMKMTWPVFDIDREEG